MKVSIKKETGILDIPEENAMNLVEITSDGKYKYDLRYIVDPRRAVQNHAITVKVFASTRQFASVSTPLLNRTNTEKTIRNIQQKSSINKDRGRSQISNVFFTYTSDISSRIPNDKTLELSGKKSNNFVIKTNKLVKLKSVSEITDTNIVMPVLENNTAQSLISSPLVRNATLSRSVSLDLATRRNVDPATISGARTNTIQSARRVSGGIISQPSSLLNQMNLTTTQRVSLLGDLINGTNPATHLQLSPSDYVNVLINSPRTTLDIHEVLYIPTEVLQADEFFIVLQLVDNRGIEIQTISTSVPHAKNVANLRIPVLAPSMAILQTGQPGKNVVQAKQIDINATGIAIYRKETKKNAPVNDAAYTFIGNISAKAGEDFQRLEDAVNNYAPILYRGIAYNDSGVLSSEFTSVGSPAIKQSNKTKHFRRQSFVSIVGEVVVGGISIEIRDVPPGVCHISLERRNLTIHEKKFSVVVKPTQMIQSDTNSPIFLTDNTVQIDRIYEYMVELLYPDGKAEISSTNLIIKYAPVVANILETTLSRPTVAQIGVGIDVTFNISSTIILNDLDLIRKTLEDQGLLSYYQDGVLDDRDKLQSIVAYGVQRTNTTTGEVEDFGIVSSGVFSDKDAGKIKAVKSLEAGYEYRYLITTFFRKAETSLENITRTVQLASGSYTFKPAKWLHPITLKSGNLTTIETRLKNHAETSFSFGSVGSITSVDISLANILPSISEARAQKLGKNSNLIQWKIQGQVTKIDHFIIVLEMLGMRTVVGKSHNISESNYFQFVDVLDNNEHGKLTYYIVPVYYDYNRGTEVSTNEVVV